MSKAMLGRIRKTHLTLPLVRAGFPSLSPTSLGGREAVIGAVEEMLALPSGWLQIIRR